jgi:hypothetical protein
MAISPGFRADLGFMGQVGYEKSLLGGGHNWYRDDKAFNRINVYADFDITHRFDGQLLERELEARVNAQGPMQSGLTLHALTRSRFWKGKLFDEHYADFSGSFRPLGNVQVGMNLQVGTMLDLTAEKTGQRSMLEVFGNAEVGRGVALNWDVILQRMRRDGGTAFIAKVLNAGGSWQRARDWAAQVVYSYKLNPHTALYAGAAYGAFMDDDHHELFGNTRSVFLKMSYGWQP